MDNINEILDFSRKEAVPAEDEMPLDLSLKGNSKQSNKVDATRAIGQWQQSAPSAPAICGNGSERNINYNRNWSTDRALSAEHIQVEPDIHVFESYSVAMDNQLVPIGSNGTSIRRQDYAIIAGFTVYKAIYTLMSFVFDVNILATHNLTGGRWKKRLDAKKVADIVECILNLSPNFTVEFIHAVMTSKCEEEAKLLKKFNKARK